MWAPGARPEPSWGFALVTQGGDLRAGCLDAPAGRCPSGRGSGHAASLWAFDTPRVHQGPDLGWGTRQVACPWRGCLQRRHCPRVQPGPTSQVDPGLAEGADHQAAWPSAEDRCWLTVSGPARGPTPGAAAWRPLWSPAEGFTRTRPFLLAFQKSASDSTLTMGSCPAAHLRRQTLCSVPTCPGLPQDGAGARGQGAPHTLPAL